MCQDEDEDKNQSCRLNWYVLKKKPVSNETIFRCNVIVRPWFVRHGQYKQKLSFSISSSSRHMSRMNKIVFFISLTELDFTQMQYNVIPNFENMGRG